MKKTALSTVMTIILLGSTATILTGCGGGGSGEDAAATYSNTNTEGTGSSDYSGSGNDGSVEDYTAFPFDAPVISDALKQEYLDAVNKARSEEHDCGEEYGIMPPVPPLEWNDSLYRAAYEHDEDMATANYIGHPGSGSESDWTAQVQELDGESQPWDRAKNNGFDGFMGENYYVGKGEGVESLEAAIEWWLNSPGHCKNLMTEKWTKMGMAKVESSTSDWNAYWTQLFGE